MPVGEWSAKRRPKPRSVIAVLRAWNLKAATHNQPVVLLMYLSKSKRVRYIGGRSIWISKHMIQISALPIDYRSLLMYNVGKQVLRF